MSRTMPQSGPWCLVESDPGVFTELCQGIGIKGVQVEEVYSLDQDVNDLKPVYGLIFLFKWRHDKTNRQGEETVPENVYFANQVIQNACATQAILNIVFNCDNEVDVGPHLREFKEFTKEFSPPLKGLTMSNSELLRTVHNGFARAQPEVPDVDTKKPYKKKQKTAIEEEEEEEIYHFVSYMPIDGHLWELDGLKRGPVKLKECTTDNWLDIARPEIQKRIAAYSANGEDIRFNLMALIRDRRIVLARRLLERDHVKTQLERRLDSLDPDWRGKMCLEKWEEEYDFETERASRRASLSPLSSPRHEATTPSTHSPTSSSPTSTSPHASRSMLPTIISLPDGKPISLVRDAPPELIRDLERDSALAKEVEDVREQLQTTPLMDLWHRLQEEKKVVRGKVEEEEEKMERYKQEIMRRKHDYTPFIVEYLKRLDQAGYLRPLLQG